MTTFAEEMQQVALELIDEFGESVTFTRKASGAYDPESQTTPEADGTTFSAFGVPMNYSAFQITEKAVEATDRRLLVHKITGNVPAVGDSVSIGGIAYRVINVAKEVVNGQDVYYDLQVRV